MFSNKNNLEASVRETDEHSLLLIMEQSLEEWTFCKGKEQFGITELNALSVNLLFVDLGTGSRLVLDYIPR